MAKTSEEDKWEMTEKFQGAIASEDTGELIALLDSGADPNYVLHGQNGETALHEACNLGLPDMIRVLMERGADPANLCSNGQLPIEWVIEYPECVEALLESGMDVNVRNQDHQTPLMIACQTARDDAAKLLLDAGADAAATDKNGKTALSFATESNDKDLIKAATKDLAPASLTSEQQAEAMLEAAKTGDLETVQQLLADGVDPDVAPKFPTRAVLAAAWEDHEDVFNALADAGADLQYERVPGQTVLSSAIVGHTDSRLRMVQRILAGVTDPKVIQGTFTHACGRASADIIREFLLLGVNVDGHDSRRNPPSLTRLPAGRRTLLLS